MDGSTVVPLSFCIHKISYPLKVLTSECRVSKVRKRDIMEEKETMSPPSSSLERTQVLEDSVYVSKLVHQFYFVKHWPTDPDSISQIKRIESEVEKMNQDICEITERIEEKMSERNHLDSRLERLNYCQREWRDRMARKGKILNDLFVAFDELCLVNYAPKKKSNKACFKGELDYHLLNSLMLHGCKSLAEEKQILSHTNIQQRDAASFKSLEVLERTIRWNDYLNNWQKFLREIEEFQIQRERGPGSDNASVKGKISNYESLKKLKKSIKDEIKHICHDSLENRRTVVANRTRIRHVQKELEAIDQGIYSLREKLTERHQKKGQAYQSILKLKNLYNEEVGKFMLEWNKNKAFREDYEKKVLKSLERRQLSRDGRRRLLDR
ncbi:hypothetical protein VNO77_28496 [Canavalia gladiata]|uniref:Uncharacterized protein n=1 Tax=Canavalia gladiata TaxID=3824 RepID=A0AAN9Q4T9_CANGL